MDLVVGEEWVEKLWVAKTEAYFEKEGIVVQELGGGGKGKEREKVATKDHGAARR